MSEDFTNAYGNLDQSQDIVRSKYAASRLTMGVLMNQLARLQLVSRLTENKDRPYA